LQIGDTFSSEVILGRENVGKAMALGMVAIVAVVMTLYVVLERRTSRWLAR
jgi:putative spermidine/putrescine transport system permease protein